MGNVFGQTGDKGKEERKMERKESFWSGVSTGIIEQVKNDSLW